MQEKARQIPLKPGSAIYSGQQGGRRGDRSGLIWWKSELWHDCGTNIYPGISAPPIKINTAAAHLLFQAGKARNVSVQTGLWILCSCWCDAALTFSCKCVKKHNEPITADSSLCVYYFRLPQLPDLMLQLTCWSTCCTRDLLAFTWRWGGV